MNRLFPNAADTRRPDRSNLVCFAGQVFQALPSGALFWARQRTLLVADLHLDKLSSYARAGQLVPPYDTRATLKRLHTDIEITGATRVISLGDSFHRPDSHEHLLPLDRELLQDLNERAEWVWIIGNHDPADHELGPCLPELEVDQITLSHIPVPGTKPMIAGHLHPCARININGRSVRERCFVSDHRLLVLPAYGATTGSLNILSPVFSGLLREDKLEVTMLGGEAVYPVATRYLVQDGSFPPRRRRSNR